MFFTENIDIWKYNEERTLHETQIARPLYTILFERVNSREKLKNVDRLIPNEIVYCSSETLILV